MIVTFSAKRFHRILHVKPIPRCRPANITHISSHLLVELNEPENDDVAELPPMASVMPDPE